MEFVEPVTVDGVYVSGSKMMLMLYDESGERVGVEVCTKQVDINMLQMYRKRLAAQTSYSRRALNHTFK